MVRAYAEAAAARGVEEICITEHLFRFRQADRLLAGWWDADPDGRLRSQTAAYWAQHATGDLEEYAAAVLGAGAAGGGDGPPIPIRPRPEGGSYPAPGLLARFTAAGVALTTASDAHELALVADGTDRLRALLADAGCTALCGFERRRPSPRSV